MMHKKTIYLTRHGETEWNIIRKMQGHLDSPLSIVGKKQAEWVMKRFQDIPLDAIYSSPLGRAHETAKTIAGDREIPIICDDRLKEIYLGSWEGCLISDVHEKDAERTYHFWNEPHKYVPIDGEYFDDVQKRVASFYHEVLVNAKYDTVLIVAHAIILKNFLAYTQNIEIKDLWTGPNLKPTSVSKGYMNALNDDSSASLINYEYIGCTRHYEEESDGDGWCVDKK